jgi:hypothetical protein
MSQHAQALMGPASTQVRNGSQESCHGFAPKATSVCLSFTIPVRMYPYASGRAHVQDDESDIMIVQEAAFQ